MSIRNRILSLVAVSLAAFSVQASAALITYTDRATFDARGTLINNHNFDDFAGTPYTYPGVPYTRGDVTYTTGQNLIVGSCTYSIGCARPVITNNYWTPLAGTIGTTTNQYNLFAFDVAVTSGPIRITIGTNLTTYLLEGLTVGNGNPSFTFEGFEATDGEYFTSFRIDTLGSGYLPGMTNVSLGQVGRTSVPEPSTLALFGMAFAGIGFARRRRA